MFQVAIYHVDQAYGGPEEGGWWYTHGDLVKVIKNHKTREEASKHCRNLNAKLEREQDADGVPRISSVLSEGRNEAKVFEGFAPNSFPEQTPHYE